MRLQGGDSGGTPTDETQWHTEVIRQALADTRNTSTLKGTFQELHSKLVSTLNILQDNTEMTTQELLDDLYTQVVAQIGAPQA
jgi:hypothetical protein